MFGTITPNGRRLAGAWVVAALFLGIYALSMPMSFKMTVQEDGPTENASAVMWLCSVLAMAVAWSRTSRRTWLTNVMFGGMTFFFFLCLGEEISWGQRIIGFASPEIMKEINHQGETTLHNVGSTLAFNNLFFMVYLSVFLFYPLVVLKLPTLRRLAAIHRPPMVTLPVVWIVATTLAGFGVVGLWHGCPGFLPEQLAWGGGWILYDDEFFEIGAAFTFFTWALLVLESRHQDSVVSGFGWR